MESKRVPQKFVRPASEDPDNSVSLFDANRENRWGEMFCLAPAILKSEVDAHWTAYLAGFEDVDRIFKAIESEADLSPMQRIIIPLVEDGYTLRISNTWSLTYGKGDHRITVHSDGSTSEYTAAAEG